MIKKVKMKNNDKIEIKLEEAKEKIFRKIVLMNLMRKKINIEIHL